MTSAKTKTTPLKPLQRNSPKTRSPIQNRFRRLRKTDGLRELVKETQLSPNGFIYPLFIEENITEPVSIKSMPGVLRHPESHLPSLVKNLQNEGVNNIMLFGVSHNKDHTGSDCMKPDGLLARMISRAKDAAPDITLTADVCFCEYTDHGHCGILTEHGDVDNDRTLDNLQIQAQNAALAGADIIAPSGMMDGAVATIRSALDDGGFETLPIMSYSTKFASHFYGPFRDAAGCSLGKGNRKTYQMDFANGREAIRESLQDEKEGADILMVKPGLAYLDIITKIKQKSDLPLAAYQVSGEYAMIKLAAAQGLVDEEAMMIETLTAFKRAGADIIISYFTPAIIKILRNN